MALAVLTVIGAMAVEAARWHLLRMAAQAEARSLSEFANLARGHAARDLPERLTLLRATLSRAEFLTEAELRNSGWLIAGRGLATPRRRGVTLGLWMPSALAAEERLVAAAWTAAPAGGRVIAPGAGAGISLTGRVGGAGRACRAGFICGHGLAWNAQAMITAFGADAPRPGSMIAVRLLHMAAHADPILHRVPVAGAAHLNEVEGAFDVRTEDVDGFASLDADQLLIGGGLDLAGTGVFSDGTVAAAASAGALGMETGTLRGRGAELAGGGDISGRALRVGNAADAGAFDAAAGSTSLEGLFVTGALNSTAGPVISAAGWSVSAGAAAAGSLAAPLISAGNVDVAGAAAAHTADVSGTVGAVSLELGGLSGYSGLGWIHEVVTPSCAGC